MVKKYSTNFAIKCSNNNNNYKEQIMHYVNNEIHFISLGKESLEGGQRGSHVSAAGRKKETRAPRRHPQTDVNTHYMFMYVCVNMCVNG